MPNIEWDRAQTLITPYADVPLNQVTPTGNRVFLVQDDYKIVPSLRVSQDNRAQADGSVLHPRFKTGLVATFSVEYVTGVEINDDTGTLEVEAACGTDLREMHEFLTGALNSIRTLTPNDQRLKWSPSGASDRILDFVQALAWTEPTVVEGITRVALAVESPFPYAVDLFQNDDTILDGATATLTNDGTADSFPVMKVQGPTSAFTITNHTTGLAVVWDSSRPGVSAIGGGDYAEIDFFRGTIFLNGSSSDLIAGFDPTATDIFPLVYTGGGVNSIGIVGADVEILWNRAWS
jgi:hypothetical protein